MVGEPPVDDEPTDDEKSVKEVKENLESVMEAVSVVREFRERADEGRGKFIPDDETAEGMVRRLALTEDALMRLAAAMTLALQKEGGFEDDDGDDERDPTFV